MKLCTKCGNSGEFCKDAQKSDGLCSICKDCNKKRTAKWQKDNPEKLLAKSKNWQKNNRDKVIASRKKFGQTHKSSINAKTAKRAASKLQRTPKWLTKDHNEQIQLFYDSASKLTNEFGMKMHVDHIIPLQGENVSGLHVPWNLQVIPAKDNQTKSNRF